MNTFPFVKGVSTVSFFMVKKDETGKLIASNAHYVADGKVKKLHYNNMTLEDCKREFAYNDQGFVFGPYFYRIKTTKEIQKDSGLSAKEAKVLLSGPFCAEFLQHCLVSLCNTQENQAIAA